MLFNREVKKKKTPCIQCRDSLSDEHRKGTNAEREIRVPLWLFCSLIMGHSRGDSAAMFET